MKTRMIWLLLFFVFFTQCHYYRLREGIPVVHDGGLNNISTYKLRAFVHVGDTYSELRNWSRKDSIIIGTSSPVTPETESYYRIGLSKKNFSASRAAEVNLLQIHFFVPQVTLIDNKMALNINQIEKIQLLDKNRGLTALSIGSTIVLGTAGAAGVFLLIACSCPHVYVQDGDHWHFSNAMFTGAMNTTLERYDYKKIPDFDPNQHICSIELRNEEQETQYTNLLKLIAVYHPKGEEVVVNQNGDFGLIKNLRFAKTAKNDDNVLISLRGEESYTFNSMNKEGFSNIYATFSTEGMHSANLVLGVKNPKWGGFVYQEFTALFGSYFQKWVESNAKKSKKSLHNNIRKSGIFLTIEVRDGKKWQRIEDIQLVGEAGFQKVAVSIPKKYLNKKDIEIRLRSGFNFWEINYLALSEKTSEGLVVEELSAHFPNQNMKSITILEKDDSQYLVHQQGEKPISVYFEGLKSAESRTLFLKSKGYYKTNHKFEGQTDWKKLMAINRTGGLSKFSKEKFDEWAVWELVLTDLGMKDSFLNTND